MWRRLRRKTFGGAGRPAVFPEQWPLVVVTLLAVVAGSPQSSGFWPAER